MPTPPLFISLIPIISKIVGVLLHLTSAQVLVTDFANFKHFSDVSSLNWKGEKDL